MSHCKIGRDQDVGGTGYPEECFEEACRDGHCACGAVKATKFQLTEEGLRAARKLLP